MAICWAADCGCDMQAHLVKNPFLMLLFPPFAVSSQMGNLLHVQVADTVCQPKPACAQLFTVDSCTQAGHFQGQTWYLHPAN